MRTFEAVTDCRLCGANTVEKKIDLGSRPIAHQMLKSENEIVETYPFEIGVCQNCGFIQIINPINPGILYENYFTISSWKNQPHAKEIARKISEIYDIAKESKIVELGCNDGTFLDLLKEHGFGNICGYEPTNDAYDIASKKGHIVKNDFFNHEAIDEIGKQTVDLVITRQVIEHIEDIHEFIGSIRKILKPTGGLVLEFPDHLMNLECLDYTFWEEHCNYFTEDTIKNLLNMHGFRIVNYESLLFSGKALVIYAKLDGAGRGEKTNYSSNKYKDITDMYCKKFPVFKEKAKQELERRLKRGHRQACVYGAGARSINFINFMELGDYIEAFIDDQREKQNLYSPGSCKLVRGYEEGDKEKYLLLGVNTENENKVIRKRNIKSFSSILPPSANIPKWWTDLADYGS